MRLMALEKSMYEMEQNYVRLQKALDEKFTQQKIEFERRIALQEENIRRHVFVMKSLEGGASLITKIQNEYKELEVEKKKEEEEEDESKSKEPKKQLKRRSK